MVEQSSDQRIVQVAKLHRAAQWYEREATERFLAFGQKLLQAQALVDSEEMEAAIREMAIPSREAQQAMKLAASGLTVDQILDSGGIEPCFSKPELRSFDGPTN